MLTESAHRLYLFAARIDDWTVESASVALGLPIRVIEGALFELTERKLLAGVLGSRSLSAIAPDVALAELVDDDERRIHELRAQVNRHRSELTALVPSYLDARERIAASQTVEVVVDPDSVQRLLIDVGRRVHEEVLIAQPGSGYSVEVNEESVTKDRELLAAGVARRTLFLDQRVDHVPTVNSVQVLEPLGARFRTLPVVPLRALIFDRSMALVSRSLDADDRAALVIRDPNLVHVLISLFDAAWEVATPFRLPGEADEPDRRGPSGATQSAILAGLMAGLTDEAIANRLDMSVRTCRRHIAAMFAVLGAESRFQAGVLAAQRGWIVPGSRGPALARSSGLRRAR